MKIRLPLIVACVLVVGTAMPRSVHADDAQPSRPPPHQKMQDDANASAQASTDMSYGGAADTRSVSGNAANQRCLPRARCDIFFGQ
ncbi:hypothetical protein [Paraburkholderia caballeronis]|uniref:Uncharacterized protein n=1 Tax=Paraburkholderia caballeronis TaxID=416943 RepID=A0A1H7P2M2_9BURK|nr:hypothetical protein [Paraburkholderia caballeronis]PXW25410.1 hypothetical protein C7403_10593 [Paraburkholderia caballeronis]PXX01017.1 hypothetical protein C7407_10592 [Paraburkholderia caballeronis]RAJ99630.1 hypothetical protein C7409_105359 [Paraburkholderia caballeronis]SEE38588.1 hypothetical protein SAMN05445871_5336 [Paraburkholderia caballeronis]SEL30062.1 hypothetical protein SAMN05192542_106204 [Paraburkholderia caballeronis]